MEITDLWVKVTYEVRLGDLEMPQEVFDEINEAIDRGRDIDTMSGNQDDDYQNASEWLTDNIKEKDCMEWKVEIIEIIEK
jgi:hypothetical protein